VTPTVLIEKLRKNGTLTLNLKIIAKSSKNEIVGLLDDGSLKVKITAAPEKGKANAAIRAFLAEEFGVARTNIEIVRGETSPLKQVIISV
jgi:uncharacterized protein (TIGR00251 family)